MDGTWHDAAQVTLLRPAAGHQGPSVAAYELDHVLAFDPHFEGNVIGNAAFSVRQRLGLEHWRFDTWPPFLLDLAPQGHARKVLVELLELNDTSAACEEPLLLRAGGGPIGNLRIKEAWEAEQERIGTHRPVGLTGEQIFGRDDVFAEFAREFAAVASGSSGVQGAWPKLLLTQDSHGRWLPDPFVPDHEAIDHAIVKWIGDKHEETALILEAEAPYLELARAFGLRCARPLTHRDGMLFIPRFDRRVANRRVVRLGQESMVSAAGVAAFGHAAAHEDYLAVLKAACTDPAAEVKEYVLRDVLNLAMGNPDNHGRNTSLQKDTDGTVRLTPLYDFCPMRLERTVVPRSTTWRCMKPFNGPSRDLAPDWDEVCGTAAGGVMDPAALKAALASKAEILRRLPEMAREFGVPDKVIDTAMARCPEIATAMDRLGRMPTVAAR